MKCASCNKENNNDAIYCNQCGNKLKEVQEPPRRMQCNDCYEYNQADAKVCEKCGSNELSPEGRHDDCIILHN